MLAYNEIKQKKIIVLEGQPFEVLSSHFAKKQRQKATNQTRLKNLKSGKVVECTFHQSDTVEEASITKQKAIYLYNHRGTFWFNYENGRRFSIEEEKIGERQKFLKENTSVDLLLFDDEIIGLSLPPKIDLKVTEAPPGVKGDTAQGGTKQVTLETGAVVSVPLFINAGDTVRVNTDTGEYTERIAKAASG
jgi:elongation factor P